MDSTSALIVVDVQHDFIEGSLAVDDAASILDVIANLAKEHWRWAVVVASMDYHPSGHCSFASTHGVQPFTKATIKGKGGTPTDQLLWPDHCVQGTRGAELHPIVTKALERWREANKAIVVQKGTDPLFDAYSALEASCTPRLDEQLRSRGIEQVVVCGLATDYCVLQTVLSSLRLGFAVIVVSNAVRAVRPESDALAVMEREGARVQSIGELAASW